MACPYFIPLRRLEIAQHTPTPLGAFFAGHCAAGGKTGPEQRLHDCCNMGYGRGRCADFPAGAASDAVRFAIGRPTPVVVPVKYAIERDHLPVSHGCLNFNRAAGRFDPPAPTPELQAQAAAYVESYLRKI